MRVSLTGMTGLGVKLAGLLKPLDGVFALPVLLVGVADVNGGKRGLAFIGAGLMKKRTKASGTLRLPIHGTKPGNTTKRLPPTKPSSKLYRRSLATGTDRLAIAMRPAVACHRLSKPFVNQTHFRASTSTSPVAIANSNNGKRHWSSIIKLEATKAAHLRPPSRLQKPTRIQAARKTPSSGFSKPASCIQKTHKPALHTHICSVNTKLASP